MCYSGIGVLILIAASNNTKSSRTSHQKALKWYYSLFRGHLVHLPHLFCTFLDFFIISKSNLGVGTQPRKKEDIDDAVVHIHSIFTHTKMLRTFPCSYTQYMIIKYT